MVINYPLNNINGVKKKDLENFSELINIQTKNIQAKQFYIFLYDCGVPYVILEGTSEDNEKIISKMEN